MHKIQRTSPTEKRGRIHTSTITIAVLPEPDHTQIKIDGRDFEFKACRGSGAGGQHRNTTDSAVQVTHIPSGLTVRCESERSQTQNRATAIALIRTRLWEAKQNQSSNQRALDRKQQIGSGQRADKRRTIRHQDGTVNDHITGKNWLLKDYLRGAW